MVAVSECREAYASREAPEEIRESLGWALLLRQEEDRRELRSEQPPPRSCSYPYLNFKVCLLANIPRS